jgi:uncharacterized protein YbjT (DUF2867 family)
MGNQGRLLLPKLAARGLKVRALDIAADPARLGAAEAIRADLLDAAALDAAMAGVASVYHLGPNAHPRENAIGRAVIDAAKRAGVGHFVFGSVLHPGITALAQHRMKAEIEEYLLESGLAWTVLAPAHYMQTLQHRPAFAGAPFRMTWSLDRRQALVDLDDVTDVAAKILAEGPAAHEGATYELVSADCLTAWEIAAHLSALLDRKVAPELVPPARVIENIFGPDADRFEERVQLFTQVAEWYAAHDFVGSPTVARALLGREPRGLAAFLARDFEAWNNG